MTPEMGTTCSYTRPLRRKWRTGRAPRRVWDQRGVLAAGRKPRSLPPEEQCLAKPLRRAPVTGRRLTVLECSQHRQDETQVGLIVGRNPVVVTEVGLRAAGRGPSEIGTGAEEKLDRVAVRDTSLVVESGERLLGAENKSECLNIRSHAIR
jgi:hypothetical protein